MSIMAKPKDKAPADAVKVLRTNRKLFDDVLMTEDLKSELIQNNVFPNNTIEELFMVSKFSF